MNHPQIPGQSLKLVTAAVLLALGSSAPALAQQQTEQQSEPQSEQQWEQQQDRQAQDGWSGQQTEQSQEREQSEWEDPDAGDDRRDATAASGRLDEITEQHQGLGKFVEAVKAAGMEESLLEGTYTVFAPTDEAIEEAGGDELLKAENRERVVELLRAHIVADDLDREMAGRIPEAMTLLGNTVQLEERDGRLTVDGANVEESEIQVAGLRIFVIDKVLGADRARTTQARTGQGS